MSAWKAGDRALCVEVFLGKDTNSGRPLEGDKPKVGTVYLVTGTRPGRISGKPGLFLAGMVAINPRSGNLCTYTASKFRKLVPACDRNKREQTELIPHEGFWEGRE